MSKQKKQQKKQLKRRTFKKRTHVAGAAGRFSRVSRAATTILNGVFGKTGIERIDKAKDIGDAVLKQVKNMKKKQSQPILDFYKNKQQNKTFLTHDTRQHHDGVIKPTPGTIKKSPATPITHHSRSEPKLQKPARHVTRSTQEPVAYAPTLYNQGANPVKKLDWND